MKLLSSIFILIVISATLLRGTAYAFEEDEDKEYSALFALSLEDLLDVKVSVASRFEQSVIDTPSNITVISKKQLQSWNVSSLWDLIARVPGMFSTLDRDQKVISARGLVDGNTRGVLILVNGVPFYDTNTLASRGIESQALDLDLLEQIEVLRGPGGLSWTGNPLLSVINLKMKKATEQGNEAHGFVGSQKTRGASFVVGNKGKDWAINFNGSYYKSDGKKIDSLTSINPANDRLRLNDDFLNQNPPFGSATFLLDEHKKSYSLFGELSYGDFKLQSYYMDFLGNNRQQEIDQGRALLEHLSRGFINLSYDWKITDRDLLNASYTIAKHDMRWYGDTGYEPTIGLVRESINHTYSLAYQKSWLESHLTVSLDYLTRGKTVSQNTNAITSPVVFNSNPKISLEQFNIVTQYEQSILDDVSVKLGGKWVSSRQGDVHINSFNPQLATIWQRTNEQVFKLAYNSGTLRPDADQIQQGLDEETEQQRISSFDFIWYQQLNEQWHTTVTLFHQTLKDRVIQRVIDGEKNYGSIGDTLSKGFTIEAEGTFAEQVFWGNISYTDAQYDGNAPEGLEADALRFDETGQVLAFPEWTVNLGLTYDVENVLISPALRYHSPITNRLVSAVDSSSNETEYKELSSSIQLDMNIEYAINSRTKVALFISNVFDENKAVPTSVFNGYTEQYGRFSRLEFSYRF